MSLAFTLIADCAMMPSFANDICLGTQRGPRHALAFYMSLACQLLLKELLPKMRYFDDELAAY